MENTDFSTVGRSDYPGYELKICCKKEVHSFTNECPERRFRIISIKEGNGVFQNGEKTQIITSPAVLCLNQEDRISLQTSSELNMDIIYFDPVCFERYIEFDSYQDWRKQLGDDAYFFRPFFERDDTYIGAGTVSHNLCMRISQLIFKTDDILHNQGMNWPCRSRSFFIELLLTVNSIFDGDSSRDHIFCGTMSDDVKNVLDWIHIHYLDKVVLEDITKEFHTNKTTLNQRFKAAMGVTVMDYIINLRMQVACSQLRKTYLPVAEIMERSGYRDDAHFLRAFKKYSGCTPTEYRAKFEI